MPMIDPRPEPSWLVREAAAVVYEEIYMAARLGLPTPRTADLAPASSLFTVRAALKLLSDGGLIVIHGGGRGKVDRIFEVPKIGKFTKTRRKS